MIDLQSLNLRVHTGDFGFLLVRAAAHLYASLGAAIVIIRIRISVRFQELCGSSERISRRNKYTFKIPIANILIKLRKQRNLFS